MYELAKENNIIVIVEPLGKILAYYHIAEGQKFIHINDELPKTYRDNVFYGILLRALSNPKEPHFMKGSAGGNE